MDLISMIEQAQGGQGLQSLGRQFGLSDEQTRAAIEQLAPVVMAGVRRNAESPDGLSGLIKALAQGGHGRYLDGDDAGMHDDGNAILGHIFGSKEVSRGIANQAADMTGIGSSLLKKMLPVIAAMVMGALAKRMTGGSGGGGLGDILGNVLGGGRGSGGGLGDILGQVLGGQSGASSRGGGLGDILGQVLGGGQSAPSAPGGGQIDDILKNIFGQSAEPAVRERAARQGRDVIGNILGGSSARGTAADDLLASVERATRQR